MILPLLTGDIAMKKKHSKTADDTKYQGTSLGKDNELQSVTIAGGPADSLSDWQLQQHRQPTSLNQGASPLSSGISSAPTSPV